MTFNNLIKFERYGNVPIDNNPDFGEKFGDACVGLLRPWGGNTVNVIQSGEDVKFEEHPDSTLSRIAVTIQSALLLPVTLILAGAGSIAYKCSTSHKKMETLYKRELNIKNLCEAKIANSKNPFLKAAKFEPMLDILNSLSDNDLKNLADTSQMLKNMVKTFYNLKLQEKLSSAIQVGIKLNEYFESFKPEDGWHRSAPFNVEYWKSIVEKLNTPNDAMRTDELCQKCRDDLYKPVMEFELFNSCLIKHELHVELCKVFDVPPLNY